MENIEEDPQSVVEIREAGAERKKIIRSQDMDELAEMERKNTGSKNNSQEDKWKAQDDMIWGRWSQ